MKDSECCCRVKSQARSEQEIQSLSSRINRITGQLNGVKKMVEDNRYCGDVLIQLCAIDKAVKALSAQILEGHLRSCVVEDIQKGDLSTIDELVQLFGRYL